MFSTEKESFGTISIFCICGISDISWLSVWIVINDWFTVRMIWLLTVEIFDRVQITIPFMIINCQNSMSFHSRNNYFVLDVDIYFSSAFLITFHFCMINLFIHFHDNSLVWSYCLLLIETYIISVFSYYCICGQIISCI